MENIFNTIESQKVGSNVFSHRHDIKTMSGIGLLTPVLVKETLPGDRWDMRAEIMVKFNPLIASLPHRFDVHLHYFWIANRVMWPEWTDWITGDSESNWPNIQADDMIGFDRTSLPAYLGLWNPDWNPEGIYKNDFNDDVSAFPFAAYYGIYHTYFTHQEISTSLSGYDEWNNLIAGTQTASCYSSIATQSLLNVAHKHNYFSSALISPQRGDEVLMPLFESDKVYLTFDETAEQYVYGKTTGARLGNVTGIGTNVTDGELDISSPSAQKALIDLDESYYLDVPSSAATITQLRSALRLQEFLEKDARGGTRYSENIIMHFGVDPDKRPAEPVYIGGAKSSITISEVISQALSIDGSSNEIPLGENAGHGMGIAESNPMSFYCAEHGILMATMFVRPVPAYWQGLETLWTRDDRLDYPWPEFANIGEQEILKREFLYSGSTKDTDTFGYAPRFADVKSSYNRITGPLTAEGYNFWHAGVVQLAPASVGTTNVYVRPQDFTKLFAYTEIDDNEQYMAWVFHDLKVVRKLTYYGTPRM